LYLNAELSIRIKAIELDIQAVIAKIASYSIPPLYPMESYGLSGGRILLIVWISCICLTIAFHVIDPDTSYAVLKANIITPISMWVLQYMMLPKFFMCINLV
jgi:hypothetical protein